MEELGVLTRVGEDANSRTGRKDYVLTGRSEKLLSVLEEVWGGDTIHNVSDIYQRRMEKASWQGNSQVSAP